MGELYRLDFASGKSYIGITSRRSYDRFLGHRSAAIKAKKKSPLYSAWRKYGPPKLIVLAKLEDADLLPTEQRAVAVFGTMTPGGYNLTPGGDFNPMKVPAIAAKTSATLTGRKYSAERCLQISKSQTGRKLSKRTKKKMSVSATGGKCSPKTCRKISRIVTKNWSTLTPEQRRSRVAPMLAARGILLEI